MEDEAADIELLEQHLIKTNNISQRMTSILTNFDNRLSRLERSILPLHNSTQSLSRLAENIEATLQSIDRIASDKVGIAAEEQTILRGPRLDDLMGYIDVVERMNANIAFASNDPRASRDTAKLVEAGVKKLCQLYTKLIAEGSSGAPPSGSNIKPPGFPSYLYDSLDPLVAALRGLPLPATHPSHPAAPAILKSLTEAQKGYGEMRGVFCKRCLEAMGGRRIIDRVESIPGIQGGKEIGMWIEGITAVAESEYQLLGRLAPLPGNATIQPSFSTLLAPLVTMTSTTLTLLITLIKGSLTKYTFLALAAYEGLGNVQFKWDDVVRKTGRKENEVKDSVNSLRAVCLRSFPEFLLDVRAAGSQTNVEVGTGLHVITTLAASYLSQLPEVLDAVGSALVAMGDGMWKMGEGAGKVFGKSDQDDERIVIEHFVYDVITALLGSLSNLANASKRPAYSSMFHLNNVSYLRNRLLLIPETPIDDLLSKPSQDALNSAYRTAKAVYFDANFSPLIQALGDMGGKKDVKEKITRFFDALDEVCDRHRTSKILPDDPEGREMLEDDVVRLVIPALARFNQKNPSLASKGSGKYIRATPEEVERQIRALYR